MHYSISVCGTGNEVCGSGETCKNSKCIARMCIYTKDHFLHDWKVWYFFQSILHAVTYML